MTRREIKLLAKEKSKGNLGLLWKGIILYTLFSGVVTYSQDITSSETILTLSQMRGWFLFSILGYALLCPLYYGTINYISNFINDKENDLGILFSNYRDIVKIFVLQTFIGILCILGLICFIVPGFVLVARYILIPYIYKDNRDLNILELMKLSGKMMKGYKFESYVFSLSFILELILVVITCGIYLIWFLPKYYVATVMYYEQIKNNYQA